MNRLGIDIILPDGVQAQDVSDGYHTFKELYDHRIMNFLVALKYAHTQGLECGWSRYHSDGELCFGGGWVIAWITTPCGLQARYHLEDTRPLPKALEKPLGSKWNGKNETLDALLELSEI